MVGDHDLINDIALLVFDARTVPSVPSDVARAILTKIGDRHRTAIVSMRERAAKWHDQRARDTPDAFEMEFHQVSAAAIRALPLAV